MKKWKKKMKYQSESMKAHVFKFTIFNIESTVNSKKNTGYRNIILFITLYFHFFN